MNRQIWISMSAALAACLPGLASAQPAPSTPSETFRSVCAATGARMDDAIKAARAAGFRNAAIPPGMAATFDRSQALERGSGADRQVIVVMSGESGFSSKVPGKVPVRACNVTDTSGGWDVRGFAREFAGLAPQFDAGGTALFSYFERAGGNVSTPEDDLPGLIAGVNAGEMRTIAAVEKDGMRSFAWVVMDKPGKPVAPPASHDAEPFAPCRWEDGSGRNPPRLLSCPDKDGRFNRVALTIDGLTEQTPAQAQGGDTAAMLRMASFYASGPEFAHDPAAVFAWSKRAADAGAPGGEFDLGLVYENGIGVAADKTQAARWYRAAADHGHVPAMINLAGLMLASDPAAAAALVKRAADADAAEGLFDMGHLSENGIGMPKDMNEAMRWYRLAAGKKDTVAMLRLGQIHADGIGGVPRDETEGARWLVAGVNPVVSLATAISSISVAFSGFENRRDAMLADARTRPAVAMQLGLYLADAKNEKRDPAEAVRMLRIAADARLIGGMLRLGIMYAEGDGVEKNAAEAIKLLRADSRWAAAGNFRRVTLFAKAP